MEPMCPDCGGPIEPLLDTNLMLVYAQCKYCDSLFDVRRWGLKAQDAQLLDEYGILYYDEQMSEDIRNGLDGA